MAVETATLGGGCFWCLEAVYDRLEGVLDVESGYANGQVLHPSYEQVCSGDTGHAEVVRIRFDTAQISFREILEIFFSIHDPTTLNRQGNDAGTQYRSGIYFHTPEQQATARAVIAEFTAAKAAKADASPVVTEVQPVQNYWPAEDYHQEYFAKHPFQGYCAFVVAPKVEKFEKTFARRLKLA